MKTNPTRYSSAVGEIWVLATFKVKYSHKIFDIKAVREITDALFHEAFGFYGIHCRRLAFDSDHVHMIIQQNRDCKETQRLCRKASLQSYALAEE